MASSWDDINACFNGRILALHADFAFVALCCGRIAFDIKRNLLARRGRQEDSGCFDALLDRRKSRDGLQNWPEPCMI